MRVLKLAVVTAFALALLAPAAFAGGGYCTKSASACTGQTAMGCPANCQVEAMRLPSGDLVVHFTGKNAEAVKYLHTKATEGASKFCCQVTQKAAASNKAKVDVTKVSNGVIVYVTSPNKEVVDSYEKEFAAISTTETK